MPGPPPAPGPDDQPEVDPLGAEPGPQGELAEDHTASPDDRDRRRRGRRHHKPEDHTADPREAEDHTGRFEGRPNGGGDDDDAGRPGRGRGGRRHGRPGPRRGGGFRGGRRG